MAKYENIKHTDSEPYWYIKEKIVVKIMGIDIGIIREETAWAAWIKN